MTITYPKRLIEVDLPIRRISEHARREKSIRHGHISTLHIWWARRPLAACRAVICAALWPDPVDDLCPQSFREAASRELVAFAEKARKGGNQELFRLSQPSMKRWNRTSESSLNPKNPGCWGEIRYALLEFIADFANWDASTQPDFLAAARNLTQAAHEALGGTPGTRPLVVDPFAGGGSIPLEALRVGADAFASDLNPVAVLLNKVVLEYIPKYGQRLADEVRKWGAWVKQEAEKELAEFYPKDADGSMPIAYLWARTVTCEGPVCGAEIPLMRSLWLAKKDKRSIALQLIPNRETKRVDFEIIEKQGKEWVSLSGSEPGIRNPEPGFEGTVKRGSATCPVCGYTTPVTSVRKQLKARRGGANDARLFCVVTTKPNTQGRFYRLPSELDLEVVKRAAERLDQLKREHTGILSLIPDEQTDCYDSFVNRGPLYGMKIWEDYFTSRQCLSLVTLMRIVAQIKTGFEKQNEINVSSIALICLNLAIDRQVDFTSSLCSWWNGGEKIQHTFAKNALAMIWDFSECNPWSGSTGDWEGAYEWGAKVCEHIGKGIEHSGQVTMSSAALHPLSNDSAQVLVSDPPYYFSIQYADLSDFFYVWLRRMLASSRIVGDYFQHPLTQKNEEIIVQSPGHEFALVGKNKLFYEKQMQVAMAEGCRFLQPSGVGVIVFAHKSTSGWEAQLQAMIDAGWIITGSWPIDTEMATRTLAQGRAVLASSIHLVCRPREDDSGNLLENIGDWRDVLQELPRRIHAWLPRLAHEGVVGADAIFACLGPALEVFSRYSRVERANGDQVTLREYLEQVWAAVSREALNLVFAGADTSGFEEDARLTAMWLWTLGGSGQVTSDSGEPGEESESDDEDGETSKSGKVSGFTLEFDAARKIAQGLGAHLEKLASLVEVKGDKARLLPVSERTKHLFGKDEATAPAKAKKKQVQRSLFEELDESATADGGWGEKNAPKLGATVLDRIHQSMILFAAGRSEALKSFLVSDGAGDERFWRLAQALSALYPTGTEEKRWVDGVLARKKGLGF